MAEHLGDDVGIALAEETFHEIPAPIERPDAKRGDHQASDEERHGE
jgi:hypothetical protein